MLLAVDVGNTHTVLGLYDGDVLVRHFRVESAKGRTADELEILLMGLAQLAGISHAHVNAAILASVVPDLNTVFAHAIHRAYGSESLLVGPGIKTGMPILYENPWEVGADRIVNAVAAYEQTRKGTIVVDFGTATTFDCISPRGEYLGGVISPGVSISAQALSASAAKLPRVEVAMPPRVVGRNTVHSMQSGIVYGYVELVDGMVRRIRQELGFPSVVLATGGLASVLERELRSIDRVDPFLTLEGLRILHARNA
ncbi:MAG: type III pantothenate kinase [Proteobacteria bacterium]|nr:type III pantothenate kinase [Pseudomonadota bacterium]